MSQTPRLISRATFASSSRFLILPRHRIIDVRSALLPSEPRFIPPQPRLLGRHQFIRTATTLSTASNSIPPNLPPLLSRPTIKVIPPSLKAIKEEGFMEDDVALVNPDEARLNITPEAIRQLAVITSKEPPDTLKNSKLALRVGVESGGCHGYQYTMAITEERGVDDYVMQPEGVMSIPVVIDLMSLGLMKGATLHHATELIGSSFRILDNPQAKDGGSCGCGVSWEAK